MNSEDIRDKIRNFIQKNSNAMGIDISKLYLAKLLYLQIEKDELGLSNVINCFEDSPKYSIVYIDKESQEYVDIFNEITFRMPSTRILSFGPMFRVGFNVTEIIRLDKIFNIDRIPIEQLKKQLFDSRDEYNLEEFIGTSLIKKR